MGEGEKSPKGILQSAKGAMLVTSRQVKTTYIINLTIIVMDGNFTTTAVGGVLFAVVDG